MTLMKYQRVALRKNIAGGVAEHTLPFTPIARVGTLYKVPFNSSAMRASLAPASASSVAPTAVGLLKMPLKR